MIAARSNRSRFIILVTLALLVALALIGAIAQTFGQKKLALTRVFPAHDAPSVMFDVSIIANPLLDLTGDFPVVIVPDSKGSITGLNAETGEREWQLALPAPPGQTIQLAATPVTVENKLVVIYQCLDKGKRVSHWLAVVDLIQKKVDPSFATLELSAEKQAAGGKAKVRFNPSTAYSHAALKYSAKPGSVWGNIYAALGNAGDVQPFHGWLFEIDMEAWQLQGARKAISHVFLTTPETSCPVSMEYGTQEMICGGGIWTPAGPQLYKSGKSDEIFVPVGNGQVDLERGDYANSLIKVQPGLQFDPGCDARLCANFNAVQPDEACLSSCTSLFIPRLKPGDSPLRPASKECDNKTFWECLAWMDYDLGASAPVKARLKDGRSVLIQPGKEGAVYLIDAQHLGMQYDRIKIVDVCGSATDACKAHWMGMIVTHPALAYIDGDPVVIIPSFVPDNTHPAGITALKVILENGVPKFKPFWQFPNRSTKKAVQKFRSHPSLPVISKLPDKDEIVWTVDIGNPGTLYGIRIKDGAVLVEQPLLGTGRQLSAPVIHENTVYLASSAAATGQAFIEAYRINKQDH